MSKHFENALRAVMRGEDANAAFKAFVNEHLGITDEPVMEDENDDKLSGDLDAEQEDAGLTEIEDNDNALLSMKSAPEIHLTNEQEHQDFFLKYNAWRGPKSENVDNLVEIRTHGKCLAEIHCDMEDQYTLQIFELLGNFYGVTTTINTEEPDYYEDLSFSDVHQVDEWLCSL